MRNYEKNKIINSETGVSITRRMRGYLLSPGKINCVYSINKFGQLGCTQRTFWVFMGLCRLYSFLINSRKFLAMSQSMRGELRLITNSKLLIDTLIEPNSLGLFTLTLSLCFLYLCLTTINLVTSPTNRYRANPV